MVLKMILLIFGAITPVFSLTFLIQYFVTLFRNKHCTELVTAEIINVEHKSDSESSWTEITIRYTFQNVVYERSCPGKGFFDSKPSTTVGDQFQVAIDPNKPKRCIIPDDRPPYRYLIWAGVFLVLFIAFYLYIHNALRS